MPVIKRVFFGHQRDNPDQNYWEPNHDVWKFCKALEDEAERTDPPQREKPLFREIDNYQKEYQHFVRFDIWCIRQLKLTFPVSHPHFLIGGRNTELLAMVKRGAQLAMTSNPFQRFDHEISQLMRGIPKGHQDEHKLVHAYQCIRDWHLSRAGFAFLLVAASALNLNGSDGPVVAVSDHHEILPILRGVDYSAESVHFLIDGVVGFDYSQGSTTIRSMTHPRSQDHGALYIDETYKLTAVDGIDLSGPRSRGNHIARPHNAAAIKIGAVPDFQKYDDYATRKEVMITWLTLCMLASPYEKTLVRNELARDHGEAIGITSTDPIRSFESIWTKAIKKLKAKHPDHVWSKSGRTRGKSGV